MFDRYSYRDFTFRYIIPVVLCLVVTIGTIRIYRIYDHWWNDHLIFHQLIDSVRAAQAKSQADKQRAN